MPRTNVASDMILQLARYDFQPSSVMLSLDELRRMMGVRLTPKQRTREIIERIVRPLR